MSPILDKKLFCDDESTAKSGTGSGSGRCKESRGSHCNATPTTLVETIQSRAISALQNLGIERISKEDYAVGFKSQFGSASRSRRQESTVTPKATNCLTRHRGRQLCRRRAPRSCSSHTLEAGRRVLLRNFVLIVGLLEWVWDTGMPNRQVSY